MNPDLVNLTALLLTALSLGTAITQTLKLKSLRKIRDSHLQLIWTKSKALSLALCKRGERDSSYKECFEQSQALEQLIVLLIANLGNFNEAEINKLKNEKIIDEYDVMLLRKITSPLK